MSDFDFLDVALIKRIDVETTVESFGSKISSTFFEAANLLGTLKLKGFVDIHSAIGNSPVIVTEKGRTLIRNLDLASEETLTRVDLAVLGNIKGGLKDPKQIESTLNLTSKDVATSIYKLHKKGFVDYRLKNAGVELMLTAQGFEHDSEDSRQYALRAGAGLAPAPGRPEVRNTVAQELASQEISVGSTQTVPSWNERVIAKAAYYFTSYWYIVLIIGVAAIGLIVAGALSK